MNSIVFWRFFGFAFQGFVKTVEFGGEINPGQPPNTKAEELPTLGAGGFLFCTFSVAATGCLGRSLKTSTKRQNHKLFTKLSRNHLGSTSNKSTNNAWFLLLFFQGFAASERKDTLSVKDF